MRGAEANRKKVGKYKSSDKKNVNHEKYWKRSTKYHKVKYDKVKKFVLHFVIFWWWYPYFCWSLLSERQLAAKAPIWKRRNSARSTICWIAIRKYHGIVHIYNLNTFSWHFAVLATLIPGASSKSTGLFWNIISGVQKGKPTLMLKTRSSFEWSLRRPAASPQ